MTWDKNELWSKHSDTFSVEVKHWKSGEKNIWNVYVRLFFMGEKSHPIFNPISNLKNSYEVDDFISFHGGCTFMQQVHTTDCFDSNKSIEIGCDYCHLDDDRFSIIDSMERAHEVFQDAESIFNNLKTKEVK